MSPQRMTSRLFSVLPLACAVALASCGGGSSVPHATPAGTSSVTFKLQQPASTTAANRRSPKYLSPATSQIAINVEQNGTSINGYPVNAALTLNNNGCSSTLATTLCEITLPLPPGSYTAILTAEDGNNVALSSQTIGFFIAAGQNNVVPLVLSGIPYAIGITTGANAVKGSASSGLTLYGSATQALLVSAFDADGNIIVGPGAPTFSATVVSGLNWDVMSPTTTAPNTVLISPPGTNGAGATLAVTASYPDSTCSQPGAVCTRTFSITNDIQTLFVANFDASSITKVVLPGGVPSTIATGIEPAALALSPAGDLFAVLYGSGIAEIAPPYTSASTLFTDVANYPVNLAVDPGGDLFIANYIGFTVAERVYPYTAAPILTLPDPAAQGLLIDPSSGNLFVLNNDTNSVQVYAPPYTGTPVSIGNSSGVNSPTKAALDGAGDLFVLNAGNTSVTEYVPPYTGAPVATITSGLSGPNALALDGAGNLFVSNETSNRVTIYAPPYTGTPTVVGTNSTLVAPFALALDGAGDLFVANFNAANVTEFAPPYTGSPIATIPTGTGPRALVLTP
jgi:hypothetical protein